MNIDPRLDRIVAAQPYPLLFATISPPSLRATARQAGRISTGFRRRTRITICIGRPATAGLPLDAVVGLEVRDETVQQEMIVPPDTSSGLRPPSPQSGEGALASRAEAHGEVESASAGELRRDSLRPDSNGGGRRLEMDIVSHDVKKFFGLLLKKIGYVLEQLYSPLIVHTTPEHAELKEICRTRLNARSSRGNEALKPEKIRASSRRLLQV